MEQKKTDILKENGIEFSGKSLYIVAVGFAILGGSALSIGCLNLGDNFGDGMLAIIIGFPLFLFGFAGLIAMIKGDKKAAKKLRAFEKTHPHWKEEQFYRSCTESGIKKIEELDYLQGYQVAAEFANKLKLPNTKEQMKKAYEIGKLAANSVDVEKANAERKRWLTDNNCANELYELFKAHGINDLSSPADLARMKLVLEQKSIPLNEVELKQVFERGKSNAQQKAIREEAYRLEKLRAEEIRQRDDLNRYLNIIGRDKMIQMYLDRAKEAQKRAEAYEQERLGINTSATNFYNAGKEHESSWAIHGGIASGIAGGAAGLAVAADVQRRNAEKRAKNEASLRAVAELQNAAAIHYGPLIKHCKSEAQSYTQKAEDAKILLVQELPENELLARLEPTTKECVVGETGTVTLTVATKEVDDLIIYEKVNALVDGSFKAILSLDGKQVGVAYLTMPASASCANYKLKGICCNLPKVPAEKYSISYEPHHLWAIEYK